MESIIKYLSKLIKHIKMSDKEIKRFSESIKRYTQKVNNDKVESKRFLVSVGIINKSGKLKKPYKNLCTPQDQA